MNTVEKSSVVWNSDTIYALGFYRTLTRLLGIWPIQRRNCFIIWQTVFGLTVQLTVIIIYINGLVTKGDCGDVIDFIDALTLIGISSISVMKLLALHVHRERMQLIVQSAIEDWNNIYNKESREIMLKYAYIGRLVFIVQMSGAYTTIIPLIFGNLPNPGVITHDPSLNTTSLFRNIPIGPNCWLSSSISENIYLLLYFLITLHLIILCTGYIGVDVYIFGITMHVCGQFELLYKNLENLDGSKDDFNLQKTIRQLIQRHSHLLMLTNEFENAFNLIVLLQVAVNCIIISFSGIILIWGLQTDNTELVIASMIRMYLLYFQLYIYCYIGEYLTTQAEKLQVAIYNCSWYQMSPLLVRELTFIMMRNNYPFYLTAGKIYVMNISNYQKLVKTMFSFFSVIRLMFE